MPAPGFPQGPCALPAPPRCAGPWALGRPASPRPGTAGGPRVPGRGRGARDPSTRPAAAPPLPGSRAQMTNKGWRPGALLLLPPGRRRICRPKRLSFPDATQEKFTIQAGVGPGNARGDCLFFQEHPTAAPRSGEEGTGTARSGTEQGSSRGTQCPSLGRSGAQDRRPSCSAVVVVHLIPVQHAAAMREGGVLWCHSVSSPHVPRARARAEQGAPTHPPLAHTCLRECRTMALPTAFIQSSFSCSAASTRRGKAGWDAGRWEEAHSSAAVSGRSGPACPMTRPIPMLTQIIPAPVHTPCQSRR